jgi:hypothetical protein
MGISKKGVSVVVASILITLVIVVSVTVLWIAILPLVQRDLGVRGEDVRVDVVGKSGYTFYDPNSELVTVQMERSDDYANLSHVEVILFFGGDSVTTRVPVPLPGQLKTYTIDVSLYGVPSSVVTVPIYLSGRRGTESVSENISLGILDEDFSGIIYDAGGNQEVRYTIVDKCNSLSDEVKDMISNFSEDISVNIILKEDEQIREGEYFVLRTDNGGKVLEVKQIYSNIGANYTSYGVRFVDFDTGATYSIDSNPEGNGQLIIDGRFYGVNFSGSGDGGYVTVYQNPLDDVIETYYCAVSIVSDSEKINISSCQQLDIVGATYVVNRDFDGSEVTKNCLNIVGDSITLDCQGHKIRNPMLEGAVIYSVGDSITIRNCDVQASNVYFSSLNNGMGKGILIRGDDNLVENNTVRNTFWGISTNVANGVIIQNNYLEGNSKAIHLENNGWDGLITNNVIKNSLTNQGWGIGIWRGNAHKIIGNEIDGASYGIVLYGADYTELGCNVLSKISKKDIYYYPSTDRDSVNVTGVC